MVAPTHNGMASARTRSRIAGSSESAGTGRREYRVLGLGRSGAAALSRSLGLCAPGRCGPRVSTSPRLPIRYRLCATPTAAVLNILIAPASDVVWIGGDQGWSGVGVDRAFFRDCSYQWVAIVTSSSVGSQEVVAVVDPVVCREWLSARGRCPAGPSALPDAVARSHR